MYPTGCPEKSVTTKQPTLRKIPEQRRHQQTNQLMFTNKRLFNYKLITDERNEKLIKNFSSEIRKEKKDMENVGMDRRKIFKGR
jgi:hypothetical protein